MAVKTITIDMEAYRLLVANKRSGESFSKVIHRRLAPVRTAESLLHDLGHLLLSEETLENLEDITKSRASSVAESPIVSEDG